MKDSGIEWLGRVPEHWEVAAVRFRYSVQLGKMLDTTKITGMHLRPYLRVFDVQWGSISVDDLPVMDFDPGSRERFRLTVGDLLVNEGGSYPGRSAIWRGELDECYFQKALHRLRPIDPSIDTSRFFFYVMAWATSQGVFTAGGNESTIEHLPAEKFRKYRLAFPPLVEQLAVADFLDRELTRFGALVAQAERSITLLQERRSALISAAVTGQIDVRNFSAEGFAA
jgi:type I restriction enzyme S subunit